MHEVAELGVAAHWQYKQGASLTEGKRYRWVRELLEILENSNNPEEFLEHTKLEMFPDQVFCFTPIGEIISLPQGATPIDFAYAVHSEVGDRCIGAKINGKMVPLRSEIKNGNQVEVLTSVDGTPSPTWESWVVTGKARARIRRYIRTEQWHDFQKLGRALLDRAFRNEGLDLNQTSEPEVLSSFNVRDFNDLAAMVGSGEVSIENVLERISPQRASVLKGSDSYKTRGKQKRNINVKPEEIPLRGLKPGIAVHYANCCHPLPGDRIIGILTPGKGVSIHIKDCETLESFAEMPERWIDVGWDLGPETNVGRIKIIVLNERGALGVLTTTIGQNLGNINNLKIVSRSKEFFELLVDIEVSDRGHLTDIIAALRATPGISSVERDRR
tara:strand:- start:485 stop:1642 length:1158 start_codon:yes stop_codon:yes gene_type:complete